MKKSRIILMNIFVVAAMIGTVAFLYYARAGFDRLGTFEPNDMPQNVELLYTLPFIVTLAAVDIASIIMGKLGREVKHKLLFAMNVLIVTAMIAVVSVFYYLLEYNLEGSASGSVAILTLAPPFLLALIVINAVSFIRDARKKKHTQLRRAGQQ